MTTGEAIAKAQGLVPYPDKDGRFEHGGVPKQGDDERRQAVACEAVSILLNDHRSGRLAYLRLACMLRAKQAIYRGATIHEAVTEAMSYWQSKAGV